MTTSYCIISTLWQFTAFQNQLNNLHRTISFEQHKQYNLTEIIRISKIWYEEYNHIEYILTLIVDIVTLGNKVGNLHVQPTKTYIHKETNMLRSVGLKNKLVQQWRNQSIFVLITFYPSNTASNVLINNTKFSILDNPPGIILSQDWALLQSPIIYDILRP